MIALTNDHPDAAYSAIKLSDAHLDTLIDILDAASNYYVMQTHDSRRLVRELRNVIDNIRLNAACDGDTPND